MLPHEQTHAEAKEERLELAARDTTRSSSRSSCSTTPTRRVEPPEGEPGASRSRRRGVRSRLWRSTRREIDLDVPLLIADGHHRYETAVAYREEEPAATHTLAVLVSSRVAGPPDLPDPPRRAGGRRSSPFGLMTSTWDTDALAIYRTGNFFRLDTDDELDAREIEQYELEGVELHAGRRGGDRGVDEDLAAARVPRARADGRAGARVRAPRRDDAAEDDLLLSQAHLRPAALLPSAESTSPGWTSAARPSPT